MKRKDVLRAAREYPKLRDALEETTTELDESRMKCAELERRCYALELQNESLSAECAELSQSLLRAEGKEKALQAAFMSFCPPMNTPEKLKQLYQCIAPQLDEEGFRLFRAAQRVTGKKNVSSEFPYEDARGFFEAADGRQLLRYLTAAYFGAVSWEVVPGTTYERTVLGEVDTDTPQYRAFESKVYMEALRDMGVQVLLPHEQQKDKQKENGKEGAER